MSKSLETQKKALQDKADEPATVWLGQAEISGGRNVCSNVR